MRKKSRDKSIFRRILIPLMLLLAAELVLFVGILFASGLFRRLVENDRDILAKQIENRKDYLENYFTGTVGNLDALSNSINRQVLELSKKGGLRLETLESEPNESAVLFSAVSDEIVEAMREKRVSGIFVILNTGDLSGSREQGISGRRTGLYIRDLDPAATPSRRNEDLVILCAPPMFVRSCQITTDNAWTPLFDFSERQSAEDYDFFCLPFQAAFEAKGEKAAKDYAYWGFAPDMAGTGYNVVYTVPLILPDGTVYGVIGAELDRNYLRSLIPYRELSNDESASYLLAFTEPHFETEASGGKLGFHPVVSSGRSGAVGTELGEMYVEKAGDGYRFEYDGASYYADMSEFRLYDSNAPFEHSRWLLMGILPERTLFSFSNMVMRRVLVSALFMMIGGILGSVLISRSISKPLELLSSDVTRAQHRSTEMPELAATGIREIDGLTGAITSLSKDIAGAKKLEQKRIEHERDHDLLTGLMNRRAFYREAGKVFASPQLLKHAAMVMLDLDNLKEVNDKYGHDWGDNYIYRAARSFEDVSPADALIARVSGDEFYILLYGYESKEDLTEVIDGIRVSIPLRQFSLPDGKEIPMGASGGVAYYPEDGTEFTLLMRFADFTMYQAKMEGKNRLLSFNIEQYQKQGSVQLSIAELDELLTNYALASYHFQPIFDAHTGEPFAYEALMRVSMKLLHTPGDVISLARQENRLADIEQMTWTRTMECFSFLRKSGAVSESARVFLNSVANLAMPDEKIRELAEQYAEIMPHVVIEITESETLGEAALAAKRVIPGFSGEFALDDYGSGYNSEIVLLNLAPKYIKVDISIVRDVDRSIDRQQIISNVVSYAHKRGMRVIAEGVETADELTTLLSLGVDLLQGFFLAEPAAIPRRISAESMQVITDFARAGRR